MVQCTEKTSVAFPRPEELWPTTGQQGLTKISSYLLSPQLQDTTPYDCNHKNVFHTLTVYESNNNKKGEATALTTRRTRRTKRTRNNNDNNDNNNNNNNNNNDNQITKASPEHDQDRISFKFRGQVGPVLQYGAESGSPFHHAAQPLAGTLPLSKRRVSMEGRSALIHMVRKNHGQTMSNTSLLCPCSCLW